MMEIIENNTKFIYERIPYKLNEQKLNVIEIQSKLNN